MQGWRETMEDAHLTIPSLREAVQSLGGSSMPSMPSTAVFPPSVVVCCAILPGQLTGGYVGFVMSVCYVFDLFDWCLIYV